MFQHINENFSQILLSCALLSDKIYDENPRKSLESSAIKHNIQKLALTVNSSNEEGFVLKYMICVNDALKQVIVVFCETQHMNDYLTNIDSYGEINGSNEASFHSTIFKHSFQIPIDKFIEQIKNDYEIVFTGHGFGGALASIIATNCLLHDSVKGREKKILTIAFGSPPFVDSSFKKFIEETRNLKDRYYFFINDVKVRAKISFRN